MNHGGTPTDEEPYSFWAAITLSATPNLGQAANKPQVDGVMVLTTGNMVVVDQNGNSMTLAGVAANAIFPLNPSRLDTSSTGTYAALYK